MGHLLSISIAPVHFQIYSRDKAATVVFGAFQKLLWNRRALFSPASKCQKSRYLDLITPF